MQFGAFDQNDHQGGLLANQYDDRLKIAELYEASGFHIYQMSEHHGTPLSATPSPSVFLSALSQRTRTLRFGPLVYLLPGYNPLRLVEEICMLDHLSRGRFEFGVGRGASAFEMAYLGVAEENLKPMYIEAIDLVRAGLSTGRMNHAGRFWSYDDVHLSVRPFQQPLPQMWAAVSSPDSAVWPALHGLNIVVGAPASNARAIFTRYLQERRRAGIETVDTPLMGLNRYIVVADSDEGALALGRRAWSDFYRKFFTLWERYGAIPGNKLPREFDEVIGRGTAIVGSVETVSRMLETQVREAGANFLSGSFVFGNMELAEACHSISLFAEHIMPELVDVGRRAFVSLREAA
jgi:alkanesulfonate monooxygenase SsuD/methylene tetrahydromethanopterin reductase-like flavin-dependent oxidoreductase (luciferase family)